MKKSKKEKSLIAFMTNGDVRSISETALPNYKKIDFLLVPVNGGDATSYLYVSSSKLLHFTKAKIKYIFTAYYFGDGCCDKAVQMDEEEKEITSLIDLCNLLHSFIRYRRIYNMENSYIDENMPPSMLIEPDLFELELYSGEELII